MNDRQGYKDLGRDALEAHVEAQRNDIRRREEIINEIAAARDKALNEACEAREKVAELEAKLAEAGVKLAAANRAREPDLDLERCVAISQGEANGLKVAFAQLLGAFERLAGSESSKVMQLDERVSLIESELE